MQKELTLRLRPQEAASNEAIQTYIARSTGFPETAINGFLITKKSIDARGKQTWINLGVNAFINEPFTPRNKQTFHFTRSTA